MRHSHARPMHQIIADVEAKNKSQHSVKPPVSSSSGTHYSAAWDSYKSSADYEASLRELSLKGLKQPYLDNILRSAFDAGYNSHS